MLPEPSFPDRPLKNGEAFTVWGAGYSLRSRAARAGVEDQVISITGFITRTNLPDAPRCAVHRAGVADPERCIAPIPAFWIGDRADAPEAESIKVIGWASNYAQIYEAIPQYRAGRDRIYHDLFWGVALPNPLPAAGAKVTVTGRYGSVFERAATGAETDDVMGLLSYEKLVYLEPSKEIATLPGLTR